MYYPPFLQTPAAHKQMSFMSGAAPSQDAATRDNTELELDDEEEETLSPLEKELQQTEQIRCVWRCVIRLFTYTYTQA